MIAFVIFALACIVVVPVALEYLPGFIGFIINIARWPLMLALVTVALACIYRYGPSRDEPKWRWITWGSAFAAIAWLGFSAIFSFYAAKFGSFNKTYGSLGAVIGFMTWMWLSIAVILIGGKVNAEMEHQTARDTTEGAPKPLEASFCLNRSMTFSRRDLALQSSANYGTNRSAGAANARSCCWRPGDRGGA
jgi:membrane protein